MIRFVPKTEAFAIALDAAAGSGSRILVFDHEHVLKAAARRLDTETLIAQPARARTLREPGIDLRGAINVACDEHARVLVEDGPFIAAFPRIVTHAQAQLAVELAQRGIDVVVRAERAAFEQLIDDRRSSDRPVVRCWARGIDSAS
jgi:hypothetical protein